MTQRDSLSSIQACAARFARLAADGSTPAGATNSYLMGGTGAQYRNLVRLTKTPNVLAAQDFTERDACGSLALAYRDRDVMQWYDLELEIIAPDPELEEMLTAAALLTGTYQASRVVADGAITSGSPTLTSGTANFTKYDVGATLSGPAGIPGATTIIAVLSATQATMSANATATATAQSVTIAPATVTIGAVAPPLGVIPSDGGVSIELWTKAIDGSSQAALLPWYHWAFPKTFWRLGGNRQFNNTTQHQTFTGFAVENPLWGNGPFNDWKLAPGASPPSAASLSQAWGRFRSNDFPVAGTFAGYIATPAQV